VDCRLGSACLSASRRLAFALRFHSGRSASQRDDIWGVAGGAGEQAWPVRGETYTKKFSGKAIGNFVAVHLGRADPDHRPRAGQAAVAIAVNPCGRTVKRKAAARCEHDDKR